MAEALERDAQLELRAIESYEPMQVMPRAREIYRDLVARLEAVEDVSTAREALRELIGEVRLIPDSDGRNAKPRTGRGFANNVGCGDRI